MYWDCVEESDLVAENTALVADSEGNLRSLVSEWVEYAEEDVNHTATHARKELHTLPHTTPYNLHTQRDIS